MIGPTVCFFVHNMAVTGFTTSLFLGFLLIQRTEPRKLILAHVVWRHGDRNPSNLIPTDVNNGLNTWPQGATGELTAQGMQQHFLLGQQLNTRYYTPFNLSPNTIAPKIYVRSTNYNRTLMSAYSNFAGFMKGITTNKNNTIPNIAGWPSLWQPIPVHTVPKETDYILRTNTYCPTVDWLFRTKVLNSPQWIAMENANKDFLNWLADKAGLVQLGLSSVWRVQDALYVESYNNHTWPSWVNQSVYNKIEQLASFADSYFYHDPDIARLRGGPLLKEIIQRMQFKVACMNSNAPNCTWINRLSYYAYSAHETTVLPLLETLARDNVGSQTGAMHLTGNAMPGFCSTVAIELYLESDGHYTVDISYKNHYSLAAFVPVPVSGSPNGVCKRGSCTLSQFVARSQPFMPGNYLQECMLTSLEEIAKVDYLEIKSPWKPIPQPQQMPIPQTPPKSPAKRQLIMVHLLWRHGDRTPVRLMPTDTANNITTWFQSMLGELTPAGMMEHFTLGQQLSKRYASWVSPQSIATQVYVRSTDYNRTLMSAYANLAGMFSSQNNLMKPNISKWPTQWQPMPVHTIPLQSDHLLYWPYCNSAEVIKRQKVWTSPAWTYIVKTQQSFMDFLAKQAGVNVTLDKIYRVSDPLYFENVSKKNHKMPSWVTPPIYKRIISLKAISDRFLFHHPEIARLKGGTLLGEIISRMINKVKCIQSSGCKSKNINSWKYYVYSAHDLTVMAFLETLARKNVGNLTGAAALTGGGLPHTASCAAVDLYQETDGSFTVEISFKNDYQSTKFVPVPVSGGCESGKCSLTTFQQRSLPFIPLDWNYECTHTPPTWTPSTVSPTHTPPTRTPSTVSPTTTTLRNTAISSNAPTNLSTTQSTLSTSANSNTGTSHTAAVTPFLLVLAFFKIICL